MAQIRLAPNTGNETVFDAGEIASADFNKTHTGLSDFRLQASPGPSWEDFVLDELWLEEDDGTLLFRGLLEAVEERESQGGPISTRLQGHGPGYRLETSETVFTVQNELMHNAIDRFWSNETSFSPVTVTQPSINNTIANETVQEANTTAEFSDITTISDTDPLTVNADELQLLQSSFTVEAEDYNRASGNPLTNSETDYSEGQSIVFSSNTVEYEWDFTVDYDIESFAIHYRNEATSQPTSVKWYLDGEEIGNTNNQLTLGWNEVYDSVGLANPTIEAGSHTIRAESVEDDTGDRYIDVLAPLDDRFNYTFDNTVDSADGNLDGPELFPDAFDFPLDSESTSWNITDGTLTTTWDDTTNNQRIQLRLTDQTFFPNDGGEDNTTSVTTDFGSEVGSSIQGRGTFSRYGTRTGTTPLTGFNGQNLQSWEITFDGNDIPVFSGSETFEGSQLEVAQQMHERARMRFTLEHSKTDLPVESYRPEDNVKSLPDLDVTAESTTTDLSQYYNKVTVRGQRENGSRLTHTVSDSTAIAEDGERVFNVLNPALDTLAAIKIEARAILIEKLRERNDKGRKQIAPIDIAAGYGRTAPFGGDDTPIEEVSYRISNGQIDGELTFDFRTGALLAEDIGGLRRNTRDAKLGF